MEWLPDAAKSSTIALLVTAQYASEKLDQNGVVLGVRGHSRSLKNPFDKEHTTSYSRSIVTMSLSRTVIEIQRDICRKSPDSDLPHLCLAPPTGVTPFEFCLAVWAQKTRIPELPRGADFVVIGSVVFTQYRRVTDGRTEDRRTDRRTDGIAFASTALAMHCGVL